MTPRPPSEPSRLTKFAIVVPRAVMPDVDRLMPPLHGHLFRRSRPRRGRRRRRVRAVQSTGFMRAVGFHSFSAVVSTYACISFFSTWYFNWKRSTSTARSISIT